jgi:phospholipid-binding lipoprotein MlaA
LELAVHFGDSADISFISDEDDTDDSSADDK